MIKVYGYKDIDGKKHYNYEVTNLDGTIIVRDLLTGNIVNTLTIADPNKSEYAYTEQRTEHYIEAVEYFTITWSELYELLYDDQWIGTADLEKMTLAMMQEASETMNELDWKPWKKKNIDLEKYKEELADVFIFLMICAKIAGMSSDDLIQETFLKHNYNKIRTDHDRNKGK